MNDLALTSFLNKSANLLSYMKFLFIAIKL
jgi:hypothetical protein